MSSLKTDAAEYNFSVFVQNSLRSLVRTSILVSLKGAESIAYTKVLEVDQSIWVLFAGSSDESIDEFVILFALQSRVLPAEVELGVEQFLVVSTAVESNTKDLGWIDASSDSVDGGFA